MKHQRLVTNVQEMIVYIMGVHRMCGTPGGVCLRTGRPHKDWKTRNCDGTTTFHTKEEEEYSCGLAKAIGEAVAMLCITTPGD